MRSDVKLRLGLIGLGGATTQLLPSILAHDDFQIAAAADPRQDARERFAAAFNAPAYESAEQLCQSGDVGVVYIGAPSHLHMQLAVTAAECRKHVIVEKPMAMTVAECDLMVEAARRNGIHLVVGHTHSFNAPIRAARDIVSSGELGALAMINTWNFNDYLYRPRWPHELRTDLGGGIIHNQVPHQVDVVRMLGGGLVQSVRSMTWSHDEERPTEGSHLTFLQFQDGSAASMTFSGYDFFDSDEFNGWVGELGETKEPNRHGSARLALSKLGGANAELELKAARAYGVGVGFPADSQGKPTYHPHFGTLVISCTKGDLRPSADGVLIYDRNGSRKVPVEGPRAYPDKSGVLDEMRDAITGTGAPPHNGEWGRATQEVCEAILASARERREIKLMRQVPFLTQKE